MAKTDRLRDESQGIEPVRIVWPITEEMYLEHLRHMLEEQIDSDAQRVPLDLRHVQGAPSGLVKLLFDMQQYAASKEKQLVVTHALADMRHALSPGKGGRNRAGNRISERVDASESARKALGHQMAPMQTVHHSARAQLNEKAAVPSTALSFESIFNKFRLPQNPRARKVLNIVVLSAGGTLILVLGYWLLMFNT